MEQAILSIQFSETIYLLFLCRRLRVLFITLGNSRLVDNRKIFISDLTVAGVTQNRAHAHRSTVNWKLKTFPNVPTLLIARKAFGEQTAEIGTKASAQRVESKHLAARAQWFCAQLDIYLYMFVSVYTENRNRWRSIWIKWKTRWPMLVIPLTRKNRVCCAREQGTNIS